jgi:hypothetical protein
MWRRQQTQTPYLCLLEAVPRANAVGHVVGRDVLQRVVVALALSGALLLPAAAQACPDCSEGREARRQVWRDDFSSNFAVALLPFLIIGAICVRVDAMGRRAPASRAAANGDGALSRGSFGVPDATRRDVSQRSRV